MITRTKTRRNNGLKITNNSSSKGRTGRATVNRGMTTEMSDVALRLQPIRISNSRGRGKSLLAVAADTTASPMGRKRNRTKHRDSRIRIRIRAGERNGHRGSR